MILPVELEKRRVLDEKIEILIPKEFKIMDSEMLDLKYKGQNKPTLVFTDEDGAVNIAFSHLPNTASDDIVEAYKNSIKNSFKKSFPNATWKGDGVKEINGRKVGYIKLVTDAIDQKVFNSLFITHCEGKLLIGTFNCTEKLLPKWEKVSEEIIESLVIK
jgi:hypothetical protein